MERKHRLGFSWLAVVLCIAMLMTTLPITPALAKSKEKTYTIKWKVNGETVKKEKVKKGEKPEKPEDPADYSDGKYTYVFVGWDPKVTKATKDMTYQAKFKKTDRKVVITWLDDEGKLIDFTEVKYGKLPQHDDPKKKPTKKYTYVFDKWEPDLVKAKEDATYTAVFKKKARQYKITWLDDKGNVIDETKVAYGKMPTHEDPVKESAKYSYTFTGWKPALTEVTGDATYTATFEKGEKKSGLFTITWLDDAGNVIDTTEVKAGKKPTHDDPVKASTEQYTYTFAGWEPKIVKAKADATYTATFTESIREYKITWLDDEGNIIDETNVPYGQAPLHDVPTLADSESYTYVFSGWMAEDGKTLYPVGEALPAVTGDAFYTAVFEEIPKNSETPETPENPETPVNPETPENPETPVNPETPENPETAETPQETEPRAEEQTPVYTISWLDDAGNVIDTTTAQQGEVPTHAAPEKPATEQYTYVFKGWTPEPAPAEANAAYTAVFEEVPIETQQEETVAPETEDPDMAVGNSVKVLFMYLTYDEQTKTMKETLIDYPQEYVEQAAPQQVYYMGTEPVRAATDTIAYKWVGWTDEKWEDEAHEPTVPKYNKSREAEKDVTEPPLLPAVTVDSPAETVYYAVFEKVPIEVKYTITWNIDGKTETTEVVKGEKPTHADPTKKDHAFDGWVPDGGSAPIPTADLPAATADATYTAQFTAINQVLPDVNCYAYIKNKDDKEKLITLLPATATLEDDGKTEIIPDWSKASLVYVESKDGVKNDGAYTYATTATSKDQSITRAVTCKIIVGPKKSETADTKATKRYTYRYDSIVKAEEAKDKAGAIIVAWDDTNDNTTNMKVPSTLDDVPVTGIDDGAFKNKQKLTAITVPAGVTAIGTGAFADCPELTTLTLPDSLTSLGLNLTDNSNKLVYKKLSVLLKTTMDYDGSCYTIKHLVEDDETVPSEQLSIEPVMSQTVTLPVGFPTDITVASPGELTLNSDFEVLADHEIKVESGTFVSNSTVINEGAITNEGTLTCGSLTNHGTIMSNGNLTVTGDTTNSKTITVGSIGSMVFYGSMTNTGTIKVNGTMSLAGSTNENRGAITVAKGATMVVEAGCKLTCYPTVTNEGTVTTKGDVICCPGTWKGNDAKTEGSGTFTNKHIPVEGSDPQVCKLCGEEIPSTITLTVSYNGSTLTKEYDLTRNCFKQTESGGYAYLITPPKAEDFKLTPPKSGWYKDANGKEHKKVEVNVGSIKAVEQFSAPDAGKYNLKFTFGLKGDDAQYYTATSVTIPAEILQRPVEITPRTGLSKAYGTDDPKYPDGSWLSKDESSPLHQDISGVPGYGVPVNTKDGSLQLSVTNQEYLLAEAKNKGTKFFPNDGWLEREAGENVGKYKITIGKMDFGSNFKMTLKDEVFEITAKNLADANITVDAIPNQKHTGKAITPEVTVRYGSTTLKKDTDYTVAYENNTDVSTTDKPAKVILTGKGNFAGTREVTFTIVKTSDSGGSSGGSSGSGSGSYDYDFEDEIEEEEPDETVGVLMLNEVDYGTILFGADGKPRPFTQYEEELPPETDEFAEDGAEAVPDDTVENVNGETEIEIEGDLNGAQNVPRRLIITADPMKDPETEESILLEGTDREQYEELHLRLSASTVQALANNGITEIVYELEQAQLRMPVNALNGEIILPVDDGSADEGEAPEDTGDIEVDEEIEVEDEFETIEAPESEGLEMDETSVPDEAIPPETVTVDGYDICIEQADANGLTERETSFIADNRKLTPPYRVRVRMIPVDAEQIPTGEVDENEQPITQPATEPLPEGYTLPDVQLRVTPDESYLVAPTEAQVLYVTVEKETEGTEETEEAAEPAAPMNPEIPAGMLAPVETPTVEGEFTLTPAVFDEEDDPIKVLIAPVLDGTYVTVVPADWDATPYLDGTADDMEAGDDEIEVDDEDEDFADDESETEFEEEPEVEEAPEDDHVYEYAFIRGTMEYQMYYVFDMDEMVARRFVTNDTAVTVGSFTGDAETGFNITWTENWKETMKVIDERKAVLIDKDGNEWDYRAVAVEAAEEQLSQPGYHDV